MSVSSLWMSLWQWWQLSVSMTVHARYKTNNSQWTIIDGNVQWQKIVLRMSLIVLARICYHCCMMQHSQPSPLSIVKIIKISSITLRGAEHSGWQLLDEGLSFHHDIMISWGRSWWSLASSHLCSISPLLLQPACTALQQQLQTNIIFDFWYLWTRSIITSATVYTKL